MHTPLPRVLRTDNPACLIMPHPLHPLCWPQVIPPIKALKEEEERRIKAAERVQKKLGVAAAPAALPAAVAGPASGLVAPAAVASGSDGSAAVVPGRGAAAAPVGFPTDGGREPGGRCEGVCWGGCRSHWLSPHCAHFTLLSALPAHSALLALAHSDSPPLSTIALVPFAGRGALATESTTPWPTTTSRCAMVRNVCRVRLLCLLHGTLACRADQLALTLPPFHLAAHAVPPAALRHRGDDDSDDEGGRRRRRVSLTHTLPGRRTCRSCPMHSAALNTTVLGRACVGLPHQRCLLNLAEPMHACSPFAPMLQRGPSPSSDPAEAARGGLRRGRSAASAKG